MSYQRIQVRAVNGDGARCGCGDRSALRVQLDDFDYFLCPPCAGAAVRAYVVATGQPRFGEAATPEYEGAAK